MAAAKSGALVAPMARIVKIMSENRATDELTGNDDNGTDNTPRFVGSPRNANKCDLAVARK